MPDRAAYIARHLAEQAEVVCRHYLSSGRREGCYWLVGDADNTPGRSMFVRLKSIEAAKPAGKWTDAATGEHGDLLDIIARREGLRTLRDALDEARRFLALPRAEPTDSSQHQTPAPTGSSETARRLFAMSKPIAGLLAETYLHERGITGARACTALRYHPRCWYRSDADDPADHVRDSWPALTAAVTDDAGIITGAHRTWLDPSGKAKVPVSTPRCAMGLIDSRDFIAARKRTETEVMLPAGPKIAFTGGADATDQRLIWDTLDKVAAKHPGMVLMHGGSPKGAELIASRWADSRKVAQIAFKPDWTRHAKAAPFKRNDAMLDILPIGVIVFAGTGIQDNLADKARKLGIPLFDFRPKSGGG